VGPDADGHSALAEARSDMGMSQKRTPHHGNHDQGLPEYRAQPTGCVRKAAARMLSRPLVTRTKVYGRHRPL
jgi:hypothetical protein